MKTKNTRNRTQNVTTGNYETWEKPKKQTISWDERHRLICEAAYFKATERNFNGNNELKDWLTAEKQIDHLYKTKQH